MGKDKSKVKTLQMHFVDGSAQSYNESDGLHIVETEEFILVVFADRYRKYPVKNMVWFEIGSETQRVIGGDNNES